MFPLFSINDHVGLIVASHSNSMSRFMGIFLVKGTTSSCCTYSPSCMYNTFQTAGSYCRRFAQHEWCSFSRRSWEGATRGFQKRGSLTGTQWYCHLPGMEKGFLLLDGVFAFSSPLPKNGGRSEWVSGWLVGLVVLFEHTALFIRESALWWRLKRGEEAKLEVLFRTPLHEFFFFLGEFNDSSYMEGMGPWQALRSSFIVLLRLLQRPSVFWEDQPQLLANRRKRQKPKDPSFLVLFSFGLDWVAFLWFQRAPWHLHTRLSSSSNPPNNLLFP